MLVLLEMDTSVSDIGLLQKVSWIDITPDICHWLVRTGPEWDQWIWSSVRFSCCILCRKRDHLACRRRDQRSSKIYPKGMACVECSWTGIKTDFWFLQGVNSVVYRILLVYLGIIFFQGIVCPFNSPELLNANSTSRFFSVCHCLHPSRMEVICTFY